MNWTRGSEDAWVELALVVELTPRRARELVTALGSADAVLAADARVLESAGVPAAVAAAIRAARGRADRVRAAARAAGATVVALASPAYPEHLRQIDDPPLALMARGDLAAGGPCVAVVGARRASEYGRRVAHELARDLARAGVTVVSGLAAGIDAAAHQGALDGGGRTVAVLGTGIDRVYPPWHRDLAAAVARQGALVSEFPLGTPPLPQHFPRRNRVISGMTLGTVVVEAAEGSGSLLTAAHAAAQGRDVLAVPGRLGMPLHRGPHRLIRDGACLVTCAEDVLEALKLPTGTLAAGRAAAAVADLSSLERRLLGALDGDGLQVDEVIRRAALPAARALETLLALELRGLVRQLPGKRFLRAA